MLNVLLALAGIMLGIAATALIGRHYFRRTINRALTPFIHLHSLVLSDIDPGVRGDLEILYKHAPVDALTHLQLLVANTGTRAIRDCIKPFSVRFPKGISILDHAILHRYPSELELKAEKETVGESGHEVVQINFPLLNRGDFFLLKFLLKGVLKPKDVECRIIVDDLPPTLDVQWLPPSATRKEARKVDWIAFGIGLGLLAVAASIAYTFFLLWQGRPNLFPYPWATYEFSVGNLIVFVFLAAALLVFLLAGILVMAGMAFEDLLSSSRHRFQLPDGLQPAYRFRFAPQELMPENDDDEGGSSKKPNAGDAVNYSAPQN